MLKTAALIKRQEAKVQSLKYLYSQIWNTVELTQSTLSAGRLREMIIIAIMKIMIIMIIIIFSKLPFVKLPPQQQAAADPFDRIFQTFLWQTGINVYKIFSSSEISHLTSAEIHKRYAR